jgi:hypothetical protein
MHGFHPRHSPFDKYVGDFARLLFAKVPYTKATTNNQRCFVLKTRELVLKWYFLICKKGRKVLLVAGLRRFPTED